MTAPCTSGRPPGATGRAARSKLRYTGYMQSFDAYIIKQVRAIPARWQPAWQIASAIGEPPVMTAVLLAVVYLTLRLNLRQAAWLVGGTIVAIGIVSVIKVLLRRARPDTYVPVLVHTYSFPSGHAFATVLIITLCAYALMTAHLISGVLAAGVGTLFVLIVGISRVRLGAHYPSDVVGGWLMALLAAGLIIHLSQS